MNTFNEAARKHLVSRKNSSHRAPRFSSSSFQSSESATLNSNNACIPSWIPCAAKLYAESISANGGSVFSTHGELTPPNPLSEGEFKNKLQSPNPLSKGAFKQNVFVNLELEPLPNKAQASCRSWQNSSWLQLELASSREKAGISRRKPPSRARKTGSKRAPNSSRSRLQTSHSDFYFYNPFQPGV